ncbi:Sodium/potassium-transporting ATPase subunit beta-2 [Orchesella cincta]|uniref:Sodium/potassium-transporting ATPase subunit beta-2 n=1 Tax=Orchesella cincta TaxID=48709 RepID=A0A1D2N7B8_ORCCI|nr:Sodium/potassium-transporting ATPase subunit beta-2 [Orchesella cincta]
MGTETDPQTKVNNNATDLKKHSYDDETWADFIWNGKTGQFLGRTGSSWVKIFVFYVVFYAGLAAFAGLCYYLFSLTLTLDHPKWLLEESIIGTNPGVGYRPMPDQETNSGSSLVWYRRDNREDTAVWYTQLANYTDLVENPVEVDSLQTCTYDNGLRATKVKSCQVDIKLFGPCNKNNNFGYRLGEPCFLIKLNRIIGWRPSPLGVNERGQYNPDILRDDLANQKNFPEWLKEHIESGVKTARDPSSFLDTVWISCAGENIADQETLGPVKYYPSPGIPGYFYPYYKQLGYQSPFIFVQFVKPKTGVLINIECRAWANNIIYNKIDRLGSVHFELMID